MIKSLRFISILLGLAFGFSVLIRPNPALAATAAEIDRDVKSALASLYAKSPSAKTLGKKAKGILVFPGIVKGGFIVGGQYGEGALLVKGKTASYYNTVQASYGLQAGVQKYGYALFFMTDDSMSYLRKSDGWELGTGPTIVVTDVGASGAATTTTLKSDVYAFFFSQKGLMAGIGLQGTKVTEISKY
jgi:lipid-binding SYLF domain-containing protein